MSKLPPPPGGFSPPPGFKAPAPTPGGPAKFSAPAPTPGKFVPPPSSTAVGKQQQQPLPFGPSGGNNNNNVAAPNNSNNMSMKSPAPAPAPAPFGNKQQAPSPASFGGPKSFPSPQNNSSQPPSQPVPQGPTSSAAAKYCPPGAPSPASAPSSNTRSNSLPTNNGNPNMNMNKSPNLSKAPAGFPAPPGSNSGMTPNSNNTNNKFPAPAPTNMNNVTKAPTAGFSPNTKSFPAPPFAGAGANNNNKAPAPFPTPGMNNNTQQQSVSRQASTNMPSPSPARPPMGFPPGPPGVGGVNNNQQQQNMKTSMPNPQMTKSMPPSFNPGGNTKTLPTPGGAGAMVGKSSFPPPGPSQMGGGGLPSSKSSFPQPPGFNNNNNNNNNNNQQQQNNNNNNFQQQQQQQSNPNARSGTPQNQQQGMMRSGTPTTPGGLSYSSPVTTGTPTQQGQPGNNFNNNQQQQQNQSSGNSSFNKLPDSSMQQQQQQQNNNNNTNSQQQQRNVPQSQSGKARMRAKPQGQNRIDSLQMPSPCRDLIVDGHPSYTYPPAVFATSKTSCPPTAASGTPCIDEGNALPKFIRPTIHQLPWDEQALDKAKLPWGAVLSPLCSKSVNAGGSSLAVANNPGSEPVRCSRCRAYMTSWNPFAGTGHSWVCAFCGMSNDVSEAYFSPITNNGKRRDYLDRPELSRGSYEVDVSGFEKYFAENPDTAKHVRPKPMNHLFIIDVSKNALTHMKPLVNSIRDAIDQMPTSGYEMCGVSFVTYASTLHFYDFSDAKLPQMIVPDVDNPFVPLPFNLLCWMNVEEDRERIEAFLQKLESGEIIDAVDETGCVLGAAAKVGQLILSDVGGCVIMTGTSMPTAGCGIIPERETTSKNDPKKEPELFKPLPGFWPNLAAESAKRFVGFNLIMFPSSNSCDMITVGQLPHLTGGKQWIFSNFREESDGLRLKRRIVHALNDEAGYGAILRTRCSAGIRVKAYHGHFMQTDPQDMDLAVVDSHSSFYVQFVHDGKLERKGAGIVQVALLYTTRSGHRRVRVHNLRMTVADTISTIFRYTDLESTLQGFISLSIHEAFNKGVKAARDWIVARTVELLVGYRVHSQSGSHSGQLLLPENLKLLPLYNLCLLKSDALISGAAVRFEDRTQNMYELLSYPQDVLLFYLYPRLFGLHHLTSNTGEYKMSAADEDEESEVDSRPKVFLPGLMQLTADNVYQGGVYLLQDLQARVVFLLIGSQTAGSVLEATFGLDPNNSSIHQVSAQNMDNWNPRVRRIVQQLIEETGRFVIVKEKTDSPMEDSFFRNLLEDEGPVKEACYSEFLCSLHKQINQKAKSM